MLYFTGTSEKFRLFHSLSTLFLNHLLNPKALMPIRIASISKAKP